VGDEQKIGYEELLAASKAGFEDVPDFTVAVEEEFALLDPATLGLVGRFEEVQVSEFRGGFANARPYPSIDSKLAACHSRYRGHAHSGQLGHVLKRRFFTHADSR